MEVTKKLVFWGDAARQSQSSRLWIFFFQMCSLLKYLIRFCHRIKMINLKFSRNEWEKLVKLCEVDPKLIDEEPPWTDDLELKIARKKLRKFVTFKLDD